MSRIPLSDESDVEPDDEIINDDVGTTGAEEQYAELDFGDPVFTDHYDDEDWYEDGDWNDEFNDAPGG